MSIIFYFKVSIMGFVIGLVAYLTGFIVPVIKTMLKRLLILSE
jgi:hypothetical protein